MIGQSSPESTSVSIAIIGGGLGGLALAVGLLKHNISFHVYESAPAFSEIGAGIAFGPNSIRALGLIDGRLIDGYKKHGAFNEDPARSKTFTTVRLGTDLRVEGSGALGARKMGDLVCHMDDEEDFDSWTGMKTRSSIHRARLLDEFIALIPPGMASFNKSTTAVEEMPNNTGVRIHFSDGTSVNASAAVGCDGIKSRTRESVLGKLDPQFTGDVIYRAMLARTAFSSIFGEEKAGNGQLYWGYGGYVIHYPVEEGKFVNMVASMRRPEYKWSDPLWQVPISAEEMREDMNGWDPKLLHALSLNPEPIRWGLFHLPHSGPYYKGRICLLGDAAHASTPHLGAGAGMAMEDAYILSHLLGEMMGEAGLEKVFAAYDSIRRPRTQAILQSSAMASSAYAFMLDDIGDDVQCVTSLFRKKLQEVSQVDLEAELKKAKLLLA